MGATLKFKGSGEGEGADDIGFKGLELETNRLLTIEDCTEEFIRGCNTEDCSVGNGSWGESSVEMKKEGYVYFMDNGNGDEWFRILATYKGLAAVLLDQVKEGTFSETTERISKIVTSKIFTYDLKFACEDYEEEEEEEEEDTE